MCKYPWLKKEVLREILKRYIKLNENENITQQNLWNITEAMLIGKFIVPNAYIKQAGKSQKSVI